VEALSLPHDTAEEHGEVFTRRWVVDLILDLCGYTSDRDLTAMRALEPACGSGAFLTAMVERLVRSARLHGGDLKDCEQALRAVDLLQSNVDASRAAVERTLLDADVEPEICERLSRSWVERDDFLLSPPEEASSDFVVGNPPYVRLEAVAPHRAAAYRQACATMGGRADLYIGFYEHGLRALRRGGTLGFICADRWMRNAYGARLRRLIATEWSPTAIVSMTGVDAFEDAVDAYPAITVFRRAPAPAGPLVVDAATSFTAADAAQITALMREPEADVAVDRFRASRLPSWFSGSGGWPHGSPERLAAIADMERRLPTLEDIETGTRVGIGVATGADRVFIVNGSADVEQERLLPLALPRDLATGEVTWSGRHLVNPWDDDGLVELADWPRMTAYLESHRAQLERRHTARRGRWHKTIDRVINGLREREKLYVPDFKDVVFPVLDCGLTYPHHNLYWIVSDRWDLEVLGGLLMSDVANLFTEAYSVRMRGGYLRFQAQYLRRIRLPSWHLVDEASANELRSAFRRRDREQATRAALPLYGLEAVPT
jgi:adenine-specific DNA-methyltransferase